MTEPPLRVRTLGEARAAGDLARVSAAIAQLQQLRGLPDVGASSGATFLDPGRDVVIARAPGRLDVMGGIADYSGSLVLEMPLDRATCAIAQAQAAPRIDVVSVREGVPFTFGVALAEVFGRAAGQPAARAAGDLAQWFIERPADRWAAYVVGGVFRCLTLNGITAPPHGLRLAITSDVPEGKGVSSSAALEVAAVAAAAVAYGARPGAADIAAACQWAENHVALAPCGIMDQMTAALGRRDRLLRLLCQPALVEGHVAIPAGYRFYGIDSGIRHAVTGADYGTVRTAAFMGYRMIAEMAGLPAESDGPRVRVTDDRWHGYLANLTSREMEERYLATLPERMRGDEFLARYGGITDVVTRVTPERDYPVRSATAHPVYEHDRVRRFAALLEGGLDRPSVAEEMGALMYASHASYGACGLASDGTDLLVDLARRAGPERGVFGAKITGGGSGGTVAVFGTDSARPVVREIAREYERETGRAAFVFEGSGPGLEELGVFSGRLAG